MPLLDDAMNLEMDPEWSPDEVDRPGIAGIDRPKGGLTELDWERISGMQNPQDNMLSIGAAQRQIQDQLQSQQQAQMQGLQREVSQPVAPTGRQQITNLSQLGAVSKALSGLPPEIKNKILRHLLGIAPASGVREQDTKAKLLQNLRQRQMQSSSQREGREIQAYGQQQARQNLEQQRSAQRQQQQQLMRFREEGRSTQSTQRAEAMKMQRDRAMNSVAGSISNLTRAMESTMDPQQRLQLGQLLQKQHRLYQQLEKFELDELKAQQTNMGNEGEVEPGGQY